MTTAARTDTIVVLKFDIKEVDTTTKESRTDTIVVLKSASKFALRDLFMTRTDTIVVLKCVLVFKDDTKAFLEPTQTWY